SGVYVANPAYVLRAAAVPRGAVITAVDGEPVANLERFEAVMRHMKDGERATVRYFTTDDPKTAQSRVMRMDRRWFPAATCRRDDKLGTWPCVAWTGDGVAAPPEPVTTTFAKTSDPLVTRLAPSLVLVHFDMPYSVSGITERNYYGTGL